MDRQPVREHRLQQARRQQQAAEPLDARRSYATASSFLFPLALYM